MVREVLLQQARSPGGPALQELVIEGCPLLTHNALRAATEASVEAGRPLLAALRVLNLAQSAGGWQGSRQGPRQHLRQGETDRKTGGLSDCWATCRGRMAMQLLLKLCKPVLPPPE